MEDKIYGMQYAVSFLKVRKINILWWYNYRRSINLKYMYEAKNKGINCWFLCNNKRINCWFLCNNCFFHWQKYKNEVIKSETRCSEDGKLRCGQINNDDFLLEKMGGNAYTYIHLYTCTYANYKKRLMLYYSQWKCLTWYNTEYIYIL